MNYSRPRSALSLGNRKPSSPVKMHRGDSNHALTEPEMGPEEEDDDDEEEEDEEDEEEEEDASRECGAGSRPTVIYANPPTKARSKKQRAAVAAHYGPPTGPLPPLPQHMGAQPPPKRRQAHSQQVIMLVNLIFISTFLDDYFFPTRISKCSTSTSTNTPSTTVGSAAACAPGQSLPRRQTPPGRSTAPSFRCCRGRAPRMQPSPMESRRPRGRRRRSSNDCSNNRYVPYNAI